VAVPDAPPAVCVVGSDLDGARAGGGADAYPDAPPPFVAAAAGTGGVGSAWSGFCSDGGSVMGSSVSVRGPLLGMGDLGGEGGTGRTEEGADRGLEIAVVGIEEELGRCIIHAVGLQVERVDLLVHGCRHMERERRW